MSRRYFIRLVIRRFGSLASELGFPVRYFKRYWNESRGAGDPRDAWGCSWWYFEVYFIGAIQRQLIAYDHGPTLRYDLANLDDEFGGLADQPIDLIEFEPYEIGGIEFEEKWTSAAVVNAKPVHGDIDGSR